MHYYLVVFFKDLSYFFLKQPKKVSFLADHLFLQDVCYLSGRYRTGCGHFLAFPDVFVY